MPKWFYWPRPGWLLLLYACAKSSACFNIVTVVSFFLWCSSKSAHPFPSATLSLDLSLVFLDVLTALRFTGSCLVGACLDSLVFLPDYLWHRSYRPELAARFAAWSEVSLTSFASLFYCLVILLFFGFFAISIELMIPEPLLVSS